MSAAFLGRNQDRINVIRVRRVWSPTVTQGRGTVRTEIFGSRSGVANSPGEARGDEHAQAAALSTCRLGQPVLVVAYSSPLY